jgi:hypothetical protein
MVSKKKRRQKRLKRMREYQAEKRKSRKEAGLCRTCGGVIEDNKFSNCSKCRQGNWNATKLYRTTHKYRKNSRKSLKNWNLKRSFGITLNEYLDMVEQQNYVCKICGGDSEYKGLAVDHDHKTNRIRGLLCDRCNRGLGHFKDDIKYLQKAIDYLELYKENPIEE